MKMRPAPINGQDWLIWALAIALVDCRQRFTAGAQGVLG
jgi:hypothetical protein